MGMFSSFRNAVAKSFDAIAETADSATKALHSANHFIGEHSKANDRIVTRSAQMRVAKFNDEHEAELDEDEDLRVEFDKVVKDWDK